MKNIIRTLLTCFLLLSFVACGKSDDHSGEAMTPSGSSTMSGQDYESVVKAFEDRGFTNIKIEKIEDLIFGWFTKDGEVEDVTVGGDVEYSPNKWVPADSEVIIRYHTFLENSEEVDKEPEPNVSQESQNENIDDEDVPAEILTIDNCPELASILTVAETYDAYSSFAINYKGRTIEFDGRIDYITKHDNYDTRYDVLVSAGDYDPDHQSGPTFKFNDVGVWDLGLDTLFLEDALKVGMNVRIVAEVVEFNSNTGLFFIKPISVAER